jgi:hypothetical protein
MRAMARRQRTRRGTNPVRAGIGAPAVAFLLASLATIGGGGRWGLVADAAAAKPRIALVGVTADQLSAEVRAKIDAAVAGGLAASGADVIDTASTSRRISSKGLVGCDTSTCRVAIAEATGAAYLVRGSVESMGRSYTVRLEMIEGATGNVVGAREDRCEICTESEAYETASVTASALKAEVIKRPAPGAAAGEGAKAGDRIGEATRAVASASPSAPPATAPEATTSMLSPPAPPASEGESAPRLRALGWAGVGAGLLAAGVGGLLVYLDGKYTCLDHAQGAKCENRFSTRSGGYALAGAGALVAALGVTLLVGKF